MGMLELVQKTIMNEMEKKEDKQQMIVWLDTETLYMLKQYCLNERKTVAKTVRKLIEDLVIKNK
jgi:hypothetical protein